MDINCIFDSLGYIPGVELLSYGNYVLSSLRNCQTVFSSFTFVIILTLLMRKLRWGRSEVICSYSPALNGGPRRCVRVAHEKESSFQSISSILQNFRVSFYVLVTSLCTEITSQSKIDLILAFSEIESSGENSK